MNSRETNIYLYYSVSEASVAHERYVGFSFEGKVPQGDIYSLSGPSLYLPRTSRQSRTLSDSPASPRSLRNRFVTSVWRNCSFGTFGRQHSPLKGQTIVNFKINVESFVVLSLAGNTSLFRWKLVLLTDL